MLKRLLLLSGTCCCLLGQAQGDARMKAYIDGLMSKMTLDEKLGQMNLIRPSGGTLTGSFANTDVEAKLKKGLIGGMFGVIGVDKIRQMQELALSQSRLKIPLIFGSDVIHGYKTTFPIPLGLASSWDMPLIERSAQLAAKEASADGLSWVFSPMVDITRDPRWGRVAEGAGEDPFLGSQVAAAMVRGYQGKNLAADSTVMACVKHFALYGAAEAGRDYNTVDMSRLRMYEYYLPPYKAALDAGCGSLMTSFNEVDGIPATANYWLVTELLRNQWKFKGFTVTDYASINEMKNHGIGDQKHASALALKAGTDMDMVSEGFVNTLKQSLAEGAVTMQQINTACRRVLEAKYKLGLFDDPYRYCNPQRAAREVTSAEQRAAARNFGVHAAVLLKNDHQTLPLRRAGTIALIGPLANNTANMLGMWSVSGDSKTSIPVLQGMKDVAGDAVKFIYAKGANITDDTLLAKGGNAFGERVDIGPGSPQQMIDDAVAAANASDVVVAVLGEASEFTGEAASRSDISLPASQRDLLEALKKTGKPLVLVLMSGRPLVLNRESALTDAMLLVWFQGHEAGHSIADLLFGNYNPSGKLTMTFPRNVGQIPIYYNYKTTGRPQPDGRAWQKYRSNYLDVVNTPLYPFGYGLSYTSFSYTNLHLSRNSMKKGERLQASITVTNSGNFDGEEVVELYIADPEASVTQPVKKLKGFQKIFLRKGESRTVSFEIGTEQLSFFNADLKWVTEPGIFRVQIGGRPDALLEAEFRLQ